MMGRWGSAIALGALLACASPAVDPEPVPVCGPLASLQPLPDRSCESGELERALSERVVEAAGPALVRVEFDEAARVRSLCAVAGPGYAASSARRSLARELDAIRALPPAPACVAGRRLDLNRYEAKWAQVHEREMRCQEQARITRETHGVTTVRDRTAPGAFGVYDREYEDCLESGADWIALDAPGSARPAIFVKPEVPDPPGPRADETRSRCLRESRVFEKRAACIESDGWERLEPARR